MSCADVTGQIPKLQASGLDPTFHTFLDLYLTEMRCADERGWVL